MPSTVHMIPEQWRCGRDETGEERRGEGLTCDGYCCWRSCWRRQVAALVVVLAVRGGRQWLSLSLSLSLFLSLCFSFSSLLLLLLLLFLSVFPLYSALSLIFSFYLFALSPPVFIGKKQGRKRTGRPLCCRSSNMWKVLGK